MNRKKMLIATLAIALLIGAVSAGILTYYGRITTTVDVKQAILLDDTPGEHVAGHTITGAGGECLIFAHKLSSQTSVPIELKFTTTYTPDVPEITTYIVEYFDDAGATIPEYEAPTSCDIEVNFGNKHYLKISAAVNAAIDGQVICVGPGTYDSAWGEIFPITIDDSITLVSLDGPETTTIDAGGAAVAVNVKDHTDGVTVKGFTVKGWNQIGIGQSKNQPMGATHVIHNIVKAPETATAHGNSIQVSGDGSTVIENDVEGTTLGSEDWAATGILVVGAENVEVRNNKVHDGDYDYGIAVAGKFAWNGPAINALIEYNTIIGASYGISVESNSQGTVVRYNHISGNVGVRELATEVGGPYIPTGTEVYYNNIEGIEYDAAVSTKGTVDLTGHTLNANNNWWGTDGIQVSGNVAASYMVKAGSGDKGNTNPFTLGAGETDWFGIYYCFDPMIAEGTSTTIKTTITVA